MIFLLRRLSLSYLLRHRGKTALALIGVAIGVALFVSIKAAQRTLVAGFQTTVDRVAGHAQLQVTGVGGVPETLRDALRELDEVGSEEPVIEQVVQPEDATLGSLLVVAVDLVGDRKIREYAFDGEDADVDDPLVFLAQPDSVALSRDFARRAAIRKGDALIVKVGAATRRLTVRALLEPTGFAKAYGGNVAVTDAYAAQDLFGRGRRFDRIDIRLRPGVTVDAGIRAVTRAVGPGYRVETPERRGAQIDQVVSAFVAAFNGLGVVAVGIGLYLIFNVFTIGIERRRRDIGILRALGVTPRQVGALFLIEAALLGALGGALGVVVGSMIASHVFAVMGAALEATHGLSDAGAPALSPVLFGQGIFMGIIASLVGAAVPIREAARVPPVLAIATGSFSARTPVARWKAPVGVCLLGLAYVLGRMELVRTTTFLTLVFGACGGVGTTLLAGVAARSVIRPIAPWLSRLSPVVGRVAADALLGRARRTASTAAVLTVSLAFVLGIAGYLHSIRTSFDRWVDNAMTADVFVRATPGLGPSQIRLPYELRSEIRKVPGIAAVGGFRNERVPFRGTTVALVSFDADGPVERTRHQFVAGDDDAFRVGLPQGRCVVSDNFARRFGLGLGDLVRLDSPTGEVLLPIAAVVVNFMSDRGTVMIDRDLFARRWLADRVDTFLVNYARGADPVRVGRDLRARLAAGAPVLISTRAEFVAEMHAALASFESLIGAVVIMSLVVALMGMATALWVSVAARCRDIGILKAVGVLQLQIGAAIVCEAVMLAVISLGLAVPLGALLAWFLRVSISETFGFRFPSAYPVETLKLVLLALPLVAALAAWMPARWAARLKVTEAVSYE